ncbi:alpha/beta hydrolase family protein [Bacillus chungangensis]|uniref:Fermentation-respiration switch protein FrsA (DUF1100 family) n=1 Tax=Bacillus chungangensis TaxID=587633 RepID=A0ABT9WQC4_9BACI|nr:alpha/beta hydrolase [Bacillus chungangensis]MDQ0175422.1 fermentation-respiration switch protein FrsA (DUF1100 family) [Bacillus chungangensis]
MISWIKYNPTEQLNKLDCPVLIVNGTRDIQVPVTDAEVLHKAKKDSKLLIVEKMNHVLKEAPEEREGNIAAYTNPDLPITQGLIDGILDFFKESDIL